MPEAWIFAIIGRTHTDTPLILRIACGKEGFWDRVAGGIQERIVTLELDLFRYGRIMNEEAQSYVERLLFQGLLVILSRPNTRTAVEEEMYGPPVSARYKRLLPACLSEVLPGPWHELAGEIPRYASFTVNDTYGSARAILDAASELIALLKKKRSGNAGVGIQRAIAMYPGEREEQYLYRMAAFLFRPILVTSTVGTCKGAQEYDEKVRATWVHGRFNLDAVTPDGVLLDFRVSGRTGDELMTNIAFMELAMLQTLQIRQIEPTTTHRARLAILQAKEGEDPAQVVARLRRMGLLAIVEYISGPHLAEADALLDEAETQSTSYGVFCLDTGIAPRPTVLVADVPMADDLYHNLISAVTGAMISQSLYRASVLRPAFSWHKHLGLPETIPMDIIASGLLESEYFSCLGAVGTAPVGALIELLPTAPRGARIAVGLELHLSVKVPRKNSLVVNRLLERGFHVRDVPVTTLAERTGRAALQATMQLQEFVPQLKRQRTEDNSAHRTRIAGLICCKVASDNALYSLGVTTNDPLKWASVSDRQADENGRELIEQESMEREAAKKREAQRQEAAEKREAQRQEAAEKREAQRQARLTLRKLEAQLADEVAEARSAIQNLVLITAAEELIPAALEADERAARAHEAKAVTTRCKDNPLDELRTYIFDQILTNLHAPLALEEDERRRRAREVKKERKEAETAADARVWSQITEAVALIQEEEDNGTLAPQDAPDEPVTQKQVIPNLADVLADLRASRKATENLHAALNQQTTAYEAVLAHSLKLQHENALLMARVVEAEQIMQRMQYDMCEMMAHNEFLFWENQTVKHLLGQMAGAKNTPETLKFAQLTHKTQQIQH